MYGGKILNRADVFEVEKLNAGNKQAKRSAASGIDN